MFNFLKSSAPAYHNLPPAQFSTEIRQPGAVLLDVRRPDEFAQGHLPGAVNIEVTAPDFAQRVASLDQQAPTYVYCRSGARSAKAADQLAKAGFTHVANLLGGVLDWPEPLTTR
ncbi:rhodanese-related sulfurtransferase [Hymenobacter luteus]|uniref:Rhodanese-like domain-containing protein n=3 Tax=Hymenobacter TaxID=89966 RepID=A0A3R9NZS5_9BACT|nr:MULTISPECIES: rhodanese-like domain-containing protein [Hymenobacter]MBB4603655.1 rhodanese-related sulfurtransferase [Hymenobacter latericoloratus]MBB6061402.1 rhodanese-related sulfurtransferase [Hymenobacter luteus]RSK25021.1 rhodanese-like domain-containing protein [Hymenobacter metallilatus]